MVNTINFVVATSVAAGMTTGFMTKPKPDGPDNTDLYALPTITLEEAREDPSLLSGTHTYSYYLNEDCSDLAVVSQTVAAKSFTIKSRATLDEEPIENLRCFAQPDYEECTESSVFSSYLTEDGFQLFETDADGDREYDFHEYGECFPTQVFGEGVWLRVFLGGEVLTDDDSLKAGHAYYDIPDATLEEVQADYDKLAGLSVNTMYATPDCTGPVIVTHTHPGTGDQLYTREPLADDPKLNLYCLIDNTAEGCVEALGYSRRYLSDEGVQIIVEDNLRVYEPTPYNTCIKSKVFGNASFKVHPGGHPIDMSDE